MTVDVIMPCWNSEQYIRDAVESMLSQTFVDFRLLVVYDPPSDKTLDILTDISKRDARVVLVRNEQKSGLVGSLNTGLGKVDAKYVARMDSDDLSRKNRLAEQVRYLEQNSDVYLLGTGYAPFNSEGTRLEILHPAGSELLAFMMMRDSYFCHPSVMFRAEIIDEIGGYPDCAAEDYAFFSKILRSYRGENLQEILLDYREHESNSSAVNRDRVKLSVRKTSEENFRYYINSSFLHKVFVQYTDSPQLESCWAQFLGPWVERILKRKIHRNYQKPHLW